MWNENGSHYGKCGTMVVLDTNQVILRSSTCNALAYRFICTYCNLFSFDINFISFDFDAFFL